MPGSLAILLRKAFFAACDVPLLPSGESDLSWWERWQPVKVCIEEEAAHNNPAGRISSIINITEISTRQSGSSGLTTTKNGGKNA